MDDSTFDDLLRKKLKDYNDPSFDPEALNDLHSRLQGHKFTGSNSNRVMRAAVATLLLLTGTNAYFILSNQELKKQLMEEYTQQPGYANYLHTVDSLNQVISQLQCELETKPVVFIKSESSAIRVPDFQMKSITTANYQTDTSKGINTRKLGIGRVKDVPSEIYQRLNEAGLLSEEEGEVFLTLTERNNRYVQTSVHAQPKNLLTDQTEPGVFRLMAPVVKHDEEKVFPPSTRQGEKSLAARNALEKHYFKGIGIQIAPHADLMRAIFSEGAGQFTPRVGITADWILSPHSSVETGVDYSSTEVFFNRSETSLVPLYPSGGTLESAIVTNKLLSAPIAFKYRQWVSDKSQLVWRTGFTPYWTMSRIAQYNFSVPDLSPDHDEDRLVTVEEINDFRYFGATMGTSLGLTFKRGKNRGAWEASLFYEHSLGGTLDQNSLQLIGLRTAYWFKIK